MSVNIYSKDEKLINVCRGSGSGLPEPEAKDKLLLSTENAETSKIEWSQVDKYKAVEIPVYETKAAAEADIANLSEGQIIATKDDGNEMFNPVDVVESGNLHAVTSNAVADAVSYSTQEVKTGGTWIDGKPIYRKVVDIGTLPDTTSKTVLHNIQNLDSVVNLKLVAKDNTNNIICNFGGIELKIYIDVANIIITTDNNFAGYTGYSVIEYTKTTD